MLLGRCLPSIVGCVHKLEFFSSGESWAPLAQPIRTACGVMAERKFAHDLGHNPVVTVKHRRSICTGQLASCKARQGVSLFTSQVTRKQSPIFPRPKRKARHTLRRGRPSLKEHF